MAVRGVAAGGTHDDSDRDDEGQRQCDVQDRTEGAMHPVVPEDGQCSGAERGDGRYQCRVPTERALQSLPEQHRVCDVERQVREEGRDQRNDHAAISELRAGLDHLGQAHLRSLRGVEGHEQRAEGDADRTREDGPAERETHRRADEPDRDGEVLEVAEEP